MTTLDSEARTDGLRLDRDDYMPLMLLLVLGIKAGEAFGDDAPKSQMLATYTRLFDEGVALGWLTEDGEEIPVGP